MGFIIVIPARHGAARLPGKPLRPIAGKPLIQHVHECACRSGADGVIVATDDERIRKTAEGFGARVCMTSPMHPSGTDRLAEVVSREGYSDDTIVVNLQGDEPLMPASLLHQVADNLAAHPTASIATLCERITHADELFNPNVVKVVMDREGYALYFSRAVIPWDRDRFAQDHRTLNPDACFYRHLGIYGYRAGFLREYTNWTPSPLEQLESLEQLRALWYGRRIHVAEAAEKNVAGVDTEEDLARVERLLLNL